MYRSIAYYDAVEIHLASDDFISSFMRRHRIVARMAVALLTVTLAITRLSRLSMMAGTWILTGSWAEYSCKDITQIEVTSGRRDRRRRILEPETPGVHQRKEPSLQPYVFIVLGITVSKVLQSMRISIVQDYIVVVYLAVHDPVSARILSECSHSTHHEHCDCHPSCKNLHEI
jgi:hypothetical protein